MNKKAREQIILGRKIMGLSLSRDDLAEKHVKLALFLDKIGADLANDLEWALGIFEKMGRTEVQSQEAARSYVAARQHLKVRRDYEIACSRAGAEDGLLVGKQDAADRSNTNVPNRGFNSPDGSQELVGLARNYLVQNAAESGADELIRALADAVSQILMLYGPIDRVLWFDWSSNDADAVAAIEELRQARSTVAKRVISPSEG